MKKKNVVIWILLATVIALVLFIFMNSLKNKEASKQDSDLIVNIIAPVIEKILGYVPENIGFVIRKLAHFTEFCFLGIAASALANNLSKKTNSGVYGYALFGVLIVAVADEFIQSFSDRGSTVSDVFIDLGGALFGFLICFIAVVLRSQSKNKNR